MLDTRYDNANGFRVILNDDRDPFVSWVHHLQRGSSGGVDLVAPYGSPLLAPCASRIQNRPWDGTGGHTIRFWHLDAFGRETGHYSEYLHCSEFGLPNGTRVNYGAYVGRSGASGNGKLRFYADHLHWHDYTARGNRVQPWNYFRPGSTGGGANAQPATPTTPTPAPERDEWDELMTMMITLDDGTKVSADAVLKDIFYRSREAVAGVTRVQITLEDGIRNLVTVATREGRSNRAYEFIETGEVAVGNSGKWQVLPKGLEEATVNIFAVLGLCQNWGDRKRLDRGGYEMARAICLDAGAFGDNETQEDLEQVYEEMQRLTALLVAQQEAAASQKTIDAYS